MGSVPAFDAVGAPPAPPPMPIARLPMELMFMLLAGRRMGVCGGIMRPLIGVIGLQCKRVRFVIRRLKCRNPLMTRTQMFARL